MAQATDRLTELQRSNRLLRKACAGLAAVILLGVGMAMQAGLEGNDVTGTALIEASQAVSDPNGFAVFVRRDGNVVIVKEDGTIIRTNSQPMAIGF